MKKMLRHRRNLWASIGLIAIALSAAFVLWYLGLPTPHPAINEASYAQIKEGMKREKVEAILAGPPRNESSFDDDFRVWDKVPKGNWGQGITPPLFRSLMSPDFLPDDVRKKQEMIDRQIEKEKGAEIAEYGNYLVAWHHNLTTITVVFDGTTDEARGAILWAPRKKTWREYPPFRWFR